MNINCTCQLPSGRLRSPGVVGIRPGLDEPLADDLPEPRPGARVTRPAHSGLLGLLGPVRPLGQHRALEPADALDGYPRRVGDLVRRLAGSDPVLDLLGSQRTLHFDVVLSEPGELASCHRP
jgi:hypothetical protein